MSLKDLFGKVTVTKSLVNKSAQEVGQEVESVRYVEADVVHEKRFIPRIDFTRPENFARYGSAKKYYSDALSNIYKTYPYDGSLAERLTWQNSSSYIDLHILDNEYPRTTGYINLSYGEWGATSISADGYGLPTTKEYISLYGGPHIKSTVPRDAPGNVWNPAESQASNLDFDLTKGVSVEFWLKKQAFDTSNTEKEVVFDLWNNEASTSTEYGRLRIELTGNAGGTDPFIVTLLSASGTPGRPLGITTASVGNSDVTVATVCDDAWHHYAFTFKSASAAGGTGALTTRFYVDGNLNKESSFHTGLHGSTGVGFQAVSGALSAYIGALRTDPSGSVGAQYAGKLSGSMDEFRYWKTQRSSKDIGRYWISQVGGGTNTELANTDLGVYYKFNEGIVGTAAKDLTILDFSGRVTNGTWNRDATYNSAIRNTGSAIVSASAAPYEFHDPIMYSVHPKVVALNTRLELSGTVYDANNNASLFSMFPSWMQEADPGAGNTLANLTQIVSSYFDSVHLQIESMNKVQDHKYVTGSTKPNVFAERLLSNRGMLAPELFLDADVLEQLADRSEDKLYLKSLNDIKNTIYQNVYNNLIHIYKAKGTEKSFRNLFRCFGIDEELIKLNMYGNNVEYQFRDNTVLSETRKRLIDFNHTDRNSALVFQHSSSANESNTVSFITGSAQLAAISGSLEKGYAFTLESEILFPKKISGRQAKFNTQNFTDLSSSLFGVHTACPDATNATWYLKGGGTTVPDQTNFQVYAVRDEPGSNNARFILTSSNVSPTQVGYVPELTSSVFNQVYDNSTWSLAVRVKPDSYPQASYTSGSLDGNPPGHKWVIELYGAQYEAGLLLNEFSASTGVAGYPASPSIAATQAGFVTGSKRVYIGAHATNFTGSVIAKSDVKMAACRYWLDYLDNDTIKAHAKDVKNYGAKAPYKNAYLFQSGSRGAPIGTRAHEVPQIETLALNWDFEQVTGSNASGQFIVTDFSSGSAALASASYGFLGPILKAQHPGLGYNFPASNTKVVDVDYLVSAKQTLPENLRSQDMISILNEAEDLQFTRETRPINFFFAFEKSMYQAISEEMLNVFGTINEFNNLIGEPVNKYRPEYKRLNKLRTLFFERVDNTPDLDKYIEFYKWFDSSLMAMINQLIPASADFSKEIRTIVENTVLSRDKYQHKFPTLEMKVPDPSGPMVPVFNASPGWKFTHRPLSGLQDTNSNWWLELAERATGKVLATPDNGVNFGRSMILRARKSIRDRKLDTPYRITFEDIDEARRIIRGGINIPRGARRDILYTATWPGGPLKPGTNIPSNVMLMFAEDVNKGKDSIDVHNPSKKKRLSFELDTAINKSVPYTVLDGATAAPFSLYSSSYPYHASGYSALVSSSFTDGVELTNLHNDVYGPHYEAPVQGPFTEKFVGGRQYRHVELNLSSAVKGDVSTYNTANGLDNSDTRPEGFKILLGKLIGGTTFKSGALGIVGPQYPEPHSPAVSPPYLYNRPKANLLREETAKRPVNIKNIKMTTADLKERMSGTIMHNRIGNYEHNYQIVQSAGRSINDPFFRDQSFDFALYPETIATRGRWPLQAPRLFRSLSFDSTGDYARNPDGVDSGAVWNGLIGGAGAAAEPYSISFWAYFNTISSNDSIYNIGSGRRTMGLSVSGINAQFWAEQDSAGNSFRKTNYGTFTTGSWVHAVMTYDGGELGETHIYVNGALDDCTTAPCHGEYAPDAFGATNYGVYISTNANSMDGYLCDVAIWDKTLSAAEVNIIYGGGHRVDLLTSGPGASAYLDIPVANLLSWWVPSTGSGGVVVDRAGGRDLTLYGDVSIQPFSPGPYPGGANSANHGGVLNYALPDRSGPNSNQSIIVNRFGAPGGYEVASLGYLDPAHEEKSVYNALPFRNLPVRSSGSGISGSMRVLDQLNHSRGLRTLEALHCGQFGIDGQYGVMPPWGSTYPTTPSWQKINRNAKQRFTYKSWHGGTTGSLNPQFTNAQQFTTGTVYDNANVSHPIPRSTKQYSWVNTSMISGAVFFGYDGLEQIPSSAAGFSTPNGWPAYKMENLLISASDLGTFNNAFIVGGPFYAVGHAYADDPVTNYAWQSIDFAGLSVVIVDPVSSSAQTLGYPALTLDIAGAFASSNYLNKSTVPGNNGRGIYINAAVNAEYGAATLLNSILLNRNGPYGWPTFRQIQAGPHSHPVVRALRNKNILSLRTRASTNRPQVFPANGNSIIQYHEAPIQSLHRPLEHTLVSLNNTEKVTDDSVYQALTYKSSYGNKIDYFTNIQLNNKLDLQYQTRRSDLYVNRLNSILLKSQADQNNSPFEELESVYVNYRQRVYPAGINAYRPQNRKREAFSIKDIWDPRRLYRSANGTKWINANEGLGRAIPGTTDLVPSASTWPLDGPLFYFMTAPEPGIGNGSAKSRRRPPMLSSSLVPGYSPLPGGYLLYADQVNPAPGAGLWGSQSAGILYNGFSGFSNRGQGTITASCTYVMRQQLGTQFARLGFPGSPDVRQIGGNQTSFPGAPQRATIYQDSGKHPFNTYEKYCENLRLVGKDYSIVPEFRISEHMDYYLNSASADFLADNDGFLSLTGSVLSSSVQNNFFKTYTNSDFLKLFDAIDADYGDNLLVNDDIIKKDKLALRCNALLKFLPYKGFYPAERTVEMARLFSASYGSEWNAEASIQADLGKYGTGGGSLYNKGAFHTFPPASRALIEPLFSPGILFNTIKSGIAVSNYIVKNDHYITGGFDLTGAYDPDATPPIGSKRKTAADHGSIYGSANTIKTFWNAAAWDVYPRAYQEGLAYFEEDNSVPWYASASLLNVPMSSAAWTPANSNHYYMEKLPFEALLEPEKYLSIPAMMSASTGDDDRGEWPMNTLSITGAASAQYIYDTGIGSASLSNAYASVDVSGETAHYLNRVSWNGDGKRNYRLAIDNFVCETLDFFQTPLNSFVSKREDQFGSVKAGKTYSMRVLMTRPLLPPSGGTDFSAGSDIDSTDGRMMKQWYLGPHQGNFADVNKFEMFSTAGAFGRPLSSSMGTNNTSTAGWAVIWGTGKRRRGATSFVHVTPAYYYGKADVTITYKPTYDGVPTLADIWENSDFYYTRTGERSNVVPWAQDLKPGDSCTTEPLLNHIDNPMRQKAMQISASINFKDKVSEIIPNTATSKNRWVIQSKFESPVLDFSHRRYNCSTRMLGVGGAQRAGYAPTTTSDNGDMFEKTKGLWFGMYGRIPSSSAAVTVEIMPPPAASQIKSSTPNESLAEIVGFTPERKTIGQLKARKTIEEAVVAIPYTTGNDGRKKFYKLKRRQVKGAIRISQGRTTATEVPQTVQHVVNSVQKYVFPPKLDFLRAPAVDPLVMYVFEFRKILTQKDLGDIWQNLPPDNTGETFQAATVTMQHSLMTDDFYDEANRRISSKMRWMVFKVKRRAASNYNKYKKKHLTSDLSTIPDSVDSRFTYNWPYDYFSLVELVKMDAGIQYASVPRAAVPPIGRSAQIETAPDCLDQTQIDQIISMGGNVPAGRGCPGTTHAPGGAGAIPEPEEN